jgi:hypothetical protein
VAFIEGGLLFIFFAWLEALTQQHRRHKNKTTPIREWESH